MQINFFKREVSCKIVYYGPGMSGKTTNLQQINEKTPAELRTNLTSIATEGERTLFFDYMPLNLGTVGSMNTKFQLYSVPGQTYYNATRKLVLQGVDGVVFVADSQKEKTDENIESLQNLMDNLKEYGITIKDIPLIIQWNKRDLPNAEKIDLLEKIVNRYNFPTTEAVAVIGKGVIETLKLIASMVLSNLNNKQNIKPSLNQKQNITTSLNQKPGVVTAPSPRSIRPASRKPSLLQRVKQFGWRTLERIRWREKIVATIDDVKINESYLINFFRVQVQMSGKSSTEEPYENLTRDQKEELLSQAVNNYLLVQESNKLGVLPSKPEIDKALALYINKFGSEEKYKSYLAQRKLKLEDLKNELSKQIIINKMIKTLVPGYQDKLKFDEKELFDYYTIHRERFDGSFEGQKKEIEQAFNKQKKATLHQELFEILRRKSKINIVLENL